jgi:hypothetical protein
VAPAATQELRMAIKQLMQEYLTLKSMNGASTYTITANNAIHVVDAESEQGLRLKQYISAEAARIKDEFKAEVAGL